MSARRMTPMLLLVRNWSGNWFFARSPRLRDPLATHTPSLGLEEGASRALQWINLLAGSHFQTHPKSFKSSERLDATFVANLLCVRNDLRDQLALRESRCHDLRRPIDLHSVPISTKVIPKDVRPSTRQNSANWPTMEFYGTVTKHLNLFLVTTRMLTLSFAGSTSILTATCSQERLRLRRSASGNGPRKNRR